MKKPHHLPEVSDKEFESMPDRISSHFDRVRDLVEQETDDSDDSDA